MGGGGPHHSNSSGSMGGGDKEPMNISSLLFSSPGRHGAYPVIHHGAPEWQQQQQQQHHHHHHQHHHHQGPPPYQKPPQQQQQHHHPDPYTFGGQQQPAPHAHNPPLKRPRFYPEPGGPASPTPPPAPVVLRPPPADLPDESLVAPSTPSVPRFERVVTALIPGTGTFLLVRDVLPGELQQQQQQQAAFRPVSFRSLRGPEQEALKLEAYEAMMAACNALVPGAAHLLLNAIMKTTVVYRKRYGSKRYPFNVKPTESIEHAYKCAAGEGYISTCSSSATNGTAPVPMKHTFPLTRVFPTVQGSFWLQKDKYTRKRRCPFNQLARSQRARVIKAAYELVQAVGEVFCPGGRRLELLDLCFAHHAGVQETQRRQGFARQVVEQEEEEEEEGGSDHEEDDDEPEDEEAHESNKRTRRASEEGGDTSSSCGSTSPERALAREDVVGMEWKYQKQVGAWVPFPALPASSSSSSSFLLHAGSSLMSKLAHVSSSGSDLTSSAASLLDSSSSSSSSSSSLASSTTRSACSSPSHP